MPKKLLVPLLSTILIVLTLVAGVSALVIDKKEIDDNKGTISLMTGLTRLIRADDDDEEEDREIEDREIEISEVSDDDRPAVDTTSSASQKTTGESVSLYAGSGSGITTPTVQPTVDAASSASIKSPAVPTPAIASPPAAATTQPAVDVIASASIKSPAVPSPAIVSPPVSSTTQPAVDAIASASLPKPGTTSPTVSNSTAPTTANKRLITEADARKIAVAAIGSTALVKEVEFEPDDYPPVYEVKLLFGGKEFKIEIHAVTGAIIHVERDEDD